MRCNKAHENVIEWDLRRFANMERDNMTRTGHQVFRWKKHKMRCAGYTKAFKELVGIDRAIVPNIHHQNASGCCSIVNIHLAAYCGPLRLERPTTQTAP